jgi:hypothetical protein
MRANLPIAFGAAALLALGGCSYNTRTGAAEARPTAGQAVGNAVDNTAQGFGNIVTDTQRGVNNAVGVPTPPPPPRGY